MPEKSVESIVDRLRVNLGGAGIDVGEADISTMVEGGYLKPVQAWERTLVDIAADAVPDYLDAWGPSARTEAGVGSGAGTRSSMPAGAWQDSPATPSPPRGLAELLGQPLHEVALLLERRELSPVELVGASLARIAARGGLLNAFQLVLADEAMAEAKVAEGEILAGRYRGPLHGIPIAIKDLLDMAGHPTSAGSKILADRVAAGDSTAVARLKEAGAVIVAKTRMSEFAYSPGSNNDHFGPTKNPRALELGLERDSGGSSSGSAAAVADGMVFAALGTDTGGSIRIPAAFCGLVGLKPTRGLLSLQGAVSLAWSLDHLGPLARNVLDAALLVDAIGGYDPLDPRTRRNPGGRGDMKGSAAAAARSGAAGLRGIRIAVLRDDGSGRELASAEGIAAWKRGLAALEAAGATLVELDLPELQGLRALNSTILAIEAALYHQAWLSTRLQDYGEFMRLRILGGFAYGPTDFIRAQQGLGLLRRRSEERLRQVDILSTPTMPGEALALGTPARLSFTAPFNALGWPAISIPVGATAEGLPLGMQLVAQPWDETTLLRTARAAELGAG